MSTIGTSGSISIGNSGSGANHINSTAFGRAGNTANSSLKELSDGTVGTINIANLNANKPNTSAPHAMSEFYGYEHSVTLNTTPGSASVGSGGATGNTISVTHATYSTWYVSSKPTWVTITGGSTSSGSPNTGDGTVTYNVASNSGSSRSGSLIVTLAVGTTGGGVGDSDSSTTRTTTISQSAGSGGGGGPGRGGGGGDE